MEVLLSIKPEFADKIFEGTKKYEFRKTVFKRSGIKKIVVYVSSPVQKVIGEFEIEDIIIDDIDALWDKTKEYSGIDKDFYNEYFKNKEQALAIKIGKVSKYQKPKYLEDFNVSFAPQSYVYI